MITKSYDIPARQPCQAREKQLPMPTAKLSSVCPFYIENMKRDGGGLTFPNITEPGKYNEDMEGGANPSSEGDPGEARSGPVPVRALNEEMRAIVEDVPRNLPWPCSSKANCPNCSVISGSSRLILSLSTMEGEAADETAGDESFVGNADVLVEGSELRCALGLWFSCFFPFSAFIWVKRPSMCNRRASSSWT